MLPIVKNQLLLIIVPVTGFGMKKWPFFQLRFYTSHRKTFTSLNTLSRCELLSKPANWILTSTFNTMNYKNTKQMKIIKIVNKYSYHPQMIRGPQPSAATERLLELPDYRHSAYNDEVVGPCAPTVQKKSVPTLKDSNGKLVTVSP